MKKEKDYIPQITQNITTVDSTIKYSNNAPAFVIEEKVKQKK